MTRLNFRLKNGAVMEIDLPRGLAQSGPIGYINFGE